MSWLDRLFRPRPSPAGEPDLAELLTTMEPVVRAYAEVVAESDSYVYRESELVHSKEKIRTALRVWAVCEPDPDARRELRMLYGLLEDFLPEGEWRLLERWHRAAKRHDYQGLQHAGLQATELLQTLAERRQRREEEFEEYLTRGGGPVLDGLGDPPPHRMGRGGYGADPRGTPYEQAGRVCPGPSALHPRCPKTPTRPSSALDDVRRPLRGTLLTHHARSGGGSTMRKGYEGLTVAVWMLLTVWVLVAIAKLLF